MVYKDLKDRILDVPLIEMSRGETSAVTEFKNSENGVLFARGSMWEGVNLPGDILSHLIIVKLPFPIPDTISEYEKIKRFIKKKYDIGVYAMELLWVLHIYLFVMMVLFKN